MSSLTLREEFILRVCENKLLRRVFGPKREEVAGGWRRLHYEELHNLSLFTKYHYSYEINEGEMGGACSTHVI
jgi:hypothetical protein